MDNELYHYGVPGMKWGINTLKGNSIDNQIPYGEEAMRYAYKSDKFKKKAAKARSKLAKNQRFINTTNKRLSELSVEDRAEINEWIKSRSA